MPVLQVTETNFDEIVTQNDFVVLDFTADWCEPCQAFSENFEKLANEFPDVVFAQIDVAQQPALAEAFSVRSVPTIIILRHHVAVFMQSGTLSAPELKRLMSDAKDLSLEDIQASLK